MEDMQIKMQTVIPTTSTLQNIKYDSEVEQTLKERAKIIIQKLIQQKQIVTPELLLQLTEEKNIQLYETKLKIIVNLPSININDGNTSVFNNRDKKINTLINSSQKANPASTVNVTFSYNKMPHKREVSDFVSYFNARYNTMIKLLQQRTDLNSATSISRIRAKKERETVTFIGMIYNKQKTKNGNIILTMEDPTGTIKVIINKEKSSFSTADDLVLDEVIGITGSYAPPDVIFANNIIIPDIPITKEIKKAPYEAYIVILSDLHIGSKEYISEISERFLQWINGNTGTEEQKHVAKNVSHIFLIGDLVDGIGIYPSQEKYLTIKDIHQQYSACAEILKQIPQQIPIIMCLGNHDATRLSEPQPPLQEPFFAPFRAFPNIYNISNPSRVTIGAIENFSGFDVILYHGVSYIIAEKIPSVKITGKNLSERSGAVMKYLLRKRHLALEYGSTLIIPENEDHHIIKEVPDFILSGHLHKIAIEQYRNVTLIEGSCWEGKTPYQEKFGVEPTPGAIPIINLKTREVIVYDFLNQIYPEFKKETIIQETSAQEPAKNINLNTKNSDNAVEISTANSSQKIIFASPMKVNI